jgi:hypothetical protein
MSGGAHKLNQTRFNFSESLSLCMSFMSLVSYYYFHFNDVKSDLIFVKLPAWLQS